MMFKFILFTLVLLLGVSPQADFEPLTASNVHRLELISTLGYGSVTRLGWIDNQTLTVGTTVNTYRHDLTHPTVESVIYRENRINDAPDLYTSPDGRIRLEEQFYGFRGGSTLQFYDTDTGQKRGDEIPAGDCLWEVSPTWQVIILACGHVSLLMLYNTYGKEMVRWDDDGGIKFTFTSDGSHLFVAYAGKVTTLWCQPPCDSSFEIPYQHSWLNFDTTLTASGNNRHLTIFFPHDHGLSRGYLEVWDYREQRQLLRYAPDVLLLNAFYTPDQDRLIAITVSEDKQFSLVVWDTTDFHQTVYPFPTVNVPDDPYRSIYDHLASITPTIEFSPDGSKLALSFYDQAFLWDLSTGDVWKPELPVDNVLSFAPDNQRIAVETTVDSVAVLNTTTQQIEHTLINYLDMEGIVSPDSRLIARFKNDHLELWDWQQMKQIPLEFDTAGLQPVQFIDAHQLLAATTEETLLLNIGTQTIVKHLPLHTYEERGEEIITQRLKDTIISADAWSGSIDLSYSDGESVSLQVDSNITAFQFAPDGKTLAVSSYGYATQSTVRIFDTFTLEEISKFEYSGTECFDEDEDYFREYYTIVSTLAFSPDGRYLAVGGLLNCKTLLEIRDLYANRVMTLPVVNRSDVSTVAFNHNGTLLASVVSYYPVQLWNTRTGEQINTKTRIYGHHLQFTDRFLFASEGWGTMRVWGVPSDESE